MAAAEGLLTALERNWDMVDRALTGLDDTALAHRLGDECNSMCNSTASRVANGRSRTGADDLG